MKLVSQFIKRVTYPLNELREGTAVLPHLRSLERTQRLDPERLHRLRLRKLHALLDHAYRNTEFYRRRFTESGITPEDIRDFDDLRRLPPLTKDDVVQYQSELIAGNLQPSELHHTTTGGSTGTHTPFYRDNKCLSVKLAAQYRFNRWCGWDVGQKVAVVWPALQDICQQESWKQRLRHALGDRHRMFDAARLDEAVLSRLADALNRFAPTLIRAFPFPLAKVAEYLRTATEYEIRPSGVLVTGEPLLQKHRKLFQEVFDCPVFNCYASRESGHIACECEAHDGLHINAECLHVEFQRDGNPAESEEPGYLLITDFENYGMPFIRYEIGDIGIRLAGQCRCGRTLPRMSMEAGRVSDFVVSPHDGSLIFGAILSHDMVAEGPNVGQLQIVQDARDHLTIRLRRNGEGTSDEDKTKHVAGVIEHVFHGAMRFTFEFTESIPREKSGKFRVCINRHIEERHS